MTPIDTIKDKIICDVNSLRESLRELELIACDINDETIHAIAPYALRIALSTDSICKLLMTYDLLRIMGSKDEN